MGRRKEERPRTAERHLLSRNADGHGLPCARISEATTRLGKESERGGKEGDTTGGSTRQGLLLVHHGRPRRMYRICLVIFIVPSVTKWRQFFSRKNVFVSESGVSYVRCFGRKLSRCVTAFARAS